MIENECRKWMQYVAFFCNHWICKDFKEPFSKGKWLFLWILHDQLTACYRMIWYYSFVTIALGTIKWFKLKTIFEHHLKEIISGSCKSHSYWIHICFDLKNPSMLDKKFLLTTQKNQVHLPQKVSLQRLTE